MPQSLLQRALSSDHRRRPPRKIAPLNHELARAWAEQRIGIAQVTEVIGAGGSGPAYSWLARSLAEIVRKESNNSLDR